MIRNHLHSHLHEIRNHILDLKHAATILLWAVSIFNVLPWGWTMDATTALVVVAAACVLSYAWISRCHARPMTEVYLAGKEAGRREALLEIECANVRRMTDHATPVERRLRVVDQG